MSQINIISDLNSLQKAYEIVKDEKLENEEGTTNEIVNQILEQVYEQFPLRIEAYKAGYLRAHTLRNFLKSFFKAEKNQCLLSKDEDKVGIITHSMFGRCLSADGFDVEG